MKILTINICNLNSLVGRHTIDFRSEPLRSAGLYAIVGPTGSGKSTVLDAITLALYGRTERDTYGAEVMSHGMGECYAEVEFVTGEGTFLSRWERRRARQRPDGNLQTPQLQLSRYDELTERYKPLPADRLNEVKQLTVGKIGLDYDQFVRSVMLTQGQFARFLSSSTKERADILEKITGTAIYNRISQAAFERHKLAREAYEKLRENQQYTHPLSDTERDELKSRLELISGELGHLRPRQEELRRQADLYRELEKASQKHAEALKAVEEGEKRGREVEGLTEALAASRRIARLREPLQQLDAVSEELRLATDKLAQRKSEREASERAHIRLVEVATSATKLLAAFTDEKSARNAAIDEATGMERRLALLQRDDETDGPRLAEAARRHRSLTTEVEEATRRREQLEQQLRGRQPEEITEEIEALDNRLDELRKQRAQLHEWHKRLLAEEALEVSREAVRNQEEELKELRAQQERAQQHLLETTESLESRRRILRQLQATKGLEPHRKELKEGEPCPLCGAVHHPALESDERLLDEDLRIAEEDVERASAARDTGRQVDRSASHAVIEAETRTTAYMERSARLEKILEELSPTGERPAGTAEEIAATLGELDVSGTEARDRQLAVRKLRSAADDLRQLLPNLVRVDKTLQETAAERSVLDKRAREREQEVKELVAQRRELLGCDAVEEARAELGRQESERQSAAKRAEIERERSASALNTARELEAEAQLRWEELETRAAEHKQRVSDLLEKFGFPDLAAVRNTLLSPDREEQYRKKTEAVERQLHSLQQAALARGEEGEAAAAAVRELPTEEKLSQELTQLEKRMESLNREHGSVHKEVELDDQRRTVYQLIAGQLEGAERDRLRWARLNDLIGQKDGVKFSRFAQTLTLRRLVEVGNGHLRRINDRYRMRHRAAEDMSRENLELEIIDTFQNDNCRPMATLSGGETFIVSLALALGLSELASGRTNIQSLFIDEGFGTLDEKILDDAVSALEQLQGQGKTIGLISHVKELRERIYCQIRLEPRGSGRSHLSVFPDIS